ATPGIPGCHSVPKQYRYWQPGSDVAWNPLHTPAGTSSWVPTVSGTVTETPYVGESRRASTYAPNASPQAIPTSLVVASPCRPRTPPRRVQVMLTWLQRSGTSRSGTPKALVRKNSRTVPRSSVTDLVSIRIRPDMAVR